MNNQPLISIITPVYNGENFLEETLRSVLKQTFTDYEFLLINDKSTDNSEIILKDFAEKDERIKVLTTSKNSGAAVARNMGLEQAKGRFIAFIDSDDIWMENKLEEQLSFMLGIPNKAFTYTNYIKVNEDLDKLGSQELPTKLNYSGLLKNTAIACSTVMIDRKIIGDFRMPLKRKGQDTATWLQILRNHPYAYLLDKELNCYRIRENSLSSNKLKALGRTWDTYRNFEKLSLLETIYYFSHYVFNAVKRRYMG